MYACLHCSAPGVGEGQLRNLALQFSPAVEQSSEDTVTFSISPLRKLMGSPFQIASEICRLGYTWKLQANLAIASNPDAAILTARNFLGATLVTPGEEAYKLAPVPLTSLFAHDARIDPNLLEVFIRWGLKTCGDLAALPEKGLAERLGDTGIYLRRLAAGSFDRPLRLSAPVTEYKQEMTLEHSLDLLEPLLFLLGRTLNELCRNLRMQAKAARALEVHFELEKGEDYHCELEFPVPLNEGATLLKLLQLHVERHPPKAAVVAFNLQVKPAEPKRIQGGFFLPPCPPPDKLQITLARIAGMVGAENVGTPVLLNTHRYDAYKLTQADPSADQTSQDRAETKPESIPQDSLHLTIRLFRPALQAQVRLAGISPKVVIASGVKGTVLQLGGPWRTSGEWWAPTAWSREEWDVALDDGAFYRIYQETQSRKWFIHGIYD
jgi:protein ImuB